METLYFIFLYICLATSIIALINKNSKPHFKAFVFLMLIKTIVEEGNNYGIFPDINKYNHWTFNIESILEFYFFSYYFYSILKGRFGKMLIKIFIFAYPVILLISFLTIQKYYIFHTNTYCLGELYLIILCLIYFRELYSDTEFKKLSTLPELWIVTGLFLFSVGELPYMILFNYLNKNHLETSLFFRKYVLGVLNILMYTMFSTGLLWSIKVQK